MPMGALISGGLSAAGALGSSFISSSAAKQASQAQAQSAQNALDFQKQIYNQNQSNLAPWMKTGSSALYSLASLYGLPTPDNPAGGGTNQAFDAFTKLPAYTFPFQQGNLALERQLNAQGRTQSGAQARETQQFGQGLASQYMMSNYVNPLMSLAGQGQGAATSLSNANISSGSQVGSSYGNLGTAQASGIMGSGNAWAGGLNNAGNSLATYSALAYGSKAPGSSGSGTYSLSGTGWSGGNSNFNPFSYSGSLY